MRKIGLTSKLNIDHIEVPVDFIDTFMPQASPEALKVYLYLLRASYDPSILLSIPDMADLFDVTPNKITRALFYWEQEGLLSLEYASDEISNIQLLPYEEHKKAAVKENKMPVQRTEDVRTAYQPEIQPKVQTPVIRQDAPIDFNILEQDASFSDLTKLLECYTRKPVTAVQYEALGFCYLLFNKDSALTEYLIEYCVEEGHPSMHYMKSVAKGWNEAGLHSVEEAKAYSRERRKRVYTVRKALGIMNRSLVQAEIDYIENWMRDFDLELITLACTKAVLKNKGYFSYVDAILNAWKTAGVHTKEDAEKQDEEFQKQFAKDQAKKNAAGDPVYAVKANYTQRETDYYSLAKNFYE